MTLKFGTSGVRGLATDFTDVECHRFVSAFIKLVRLKSHPSEILIAGDLRASTPSIVNQVIRSIQANGLNVLDGGVGPTPALAWACSEKNVPGIMITGSHIPGDRNGLKFYFSKGEILKEDEAQISTFKSELNQDLGLNDKSVDPKKVLTVDINALFKNRYLSALPNQPLRGLKLGFYQHSSVARDLYPELLRDLGAIVVEFGRSNTFKAVDTEAVESVEFIYEIIRAEGLDAVVSTDGDSDRPLVVTDQGKAIPGEILGLITSIFLKIDSVSYPVSCSSIVANSKEVPHHLVTKIGSPYVLGSMLENLRLHPGRKLAGFEANGGYLLGSEVSGLKPLMTRDSFLPILGFFLQMKAKGCQKPSELLRHYGNRSNLSGLVRDFALEQVPGVLKRFKALTEIMGLKVTQTNELDGVRVTLEDQSIVHLRPSGNAPEFRIYVEALSEDRAQQFLDHFKNFVIDEQNS